MKPVVGYEKYFSVTEDGKIYSHRTNKFLKLHIDNNNNVCFASKIGGRNGVSIRLTVHRCVAQAYIDNPDNKPEVNHKDGNRTNNNVSNLEWATRSENIQHAYNTGLKFAAKGTKNANSKLSDKDVQEIRQNIEKLTIRELAVKYGAHHSTISRCVTNKRYK